jgi:hypothetical protein
MIGELIAKYRGGVIAVLVVALVYGGYQFFVKPNLKDVDLISVSGPVVGTEVQGETLQLLQVLRSIKLDATVFESKTFRSLEDFSVPLREEPKSRSNPFAPVGSSQQVRTP